MSPQHVLIIGAGLTGLAIAHGLEKEGIPYTIVDAEDQTVARPRRWTMALHWGLPMLEALLPQHLADRVRVDAVVDPSLDYGKHPNNILSLYDGATGQLVKEIASDGLRVDRTRLRALCAEGIDVKWGHVLRDITYHDDGTVTAGFANGAAHTGTLLVGADGPRSAVRAALFGPGAVPRPIGLVIVNVHFRYPDAAQARLVRGLAPVASMAAGAECFVLVSVQDARGADGGGGGGGGGAAASGDPASWRFQVIMVWRGDHAARASHEERHAEVRRRAASLAEPFRSAVLWMPRDVQIRYDPLGCWAPPPAPWDTRDGRVTLAGDAAHAMTPFRGQGLNNAVNDASNLVSAIKTLEVVPANQAGVIGEYSREVAYRGSDEVRLSIQQAMLMTDHDRFRTSPMLTHGLKKTVRPSMPSGI